MARIVSLVRSRHWQWQSRHLLIFYTSRHTHGATDCTPDNDCWQDPFDVFCRKWNRAFCDTDQGHEGGPINKTATAFTLALMAEGVYGPNGAHRIACAIPPLAMPDNDCWQDPFDVFCRKWNRAFCDTDQGHEECRNSQVFIFGGIFFPINKCRRVLPAIIIGSAVGGAMGMATGVEALVPHGGFIITTIYRSRPAG
jgi:hypothetical protein